MDINQEYRLGNTKFIDSPNVDNYQVVNLEGNQKELIEYDVKNLLDVTDVFNTERQETDIYRIYGRVEYMSLLNGITPSYTKLIDFFTQFTGSTARSVLNSFDFYLLRPSSGYTSLGNNKYVKMYEVIATPSNFDIYRAAFFVNIYNEQQHLFNFKKDFDVTGLLDGLHFPITDFAIYANYKPVNGETMQRRTYTSGSSETVFGKVTHANVPLSIGSIVYGNLLEYNEAGYIAPVINEQTYYITCNYVQSGTKQLVFMYNPITEISIKVMDDTLVMVNISGTSYQDIQSVPYYAIPYGNTGNYIWRPILEKGFFDPLTGRGVNFPFVNQRQYVFKNYIISMWPDMSHLNTATVFDQIEYAPNTLLSKSPTDLDNMGNVC